MVSVNKEMYTHTYNHLILLFCPVKINKTHMYRLLLITHITNHALLKHQ